MADEARKEAAAYIREAENNLKASSGFFGLFTSGPNYFDAVDCYNRAGNVLKSAKLCKLTTLHSSNSAFRDRSW